MKKIRVLSIGHSYVIAINRSFMRVLAEDPLYEVTVVSPSFVKGSLRSVLCEPELPSSRLKLVPIKAYLTGQTHIFFYDHFALKKILKKQDFDIVYIWQEPYIVSGFQIASLIPKELPFCFFTAQNINKKYFFPFNYFEEYTFKKAKAWVACGELVKQTMQLKNHNVDNCHVIPLAVDCSKFMTISSQEKKHFKLSLNFQSPLIMYMGRLTPEKGVRLIMRLIEKLDRSKSWSFLFMGSGAMQAEIDAWIKLQNLTDRVKLMFYSHHEIPNVLNKGDILLCPSQTMKFWKEQFGRMIVEAFASGLAVVGSDSGEIPYVIGDAGLVLNEKNELAWLEVVNNLLENPKLIETYGAAGLIRSKVFSSESVAEQFSQLFKKMTRF